MSPDAASSNEHIIKPLAPCNVLGKMEKVRGMDKDNAVKNLVCDTAFLSGKFYFSSCQNKMSVQELFLLLLDQRNIFTYPESGGSLHVV